MAPDRCCHDSTTGCREQRRAAPGTFQPAGETAVKPLKIMTLGYADPSFGRDGSRQSRDHAA